MTGQLYHLRTEIFIALKHMFSAEGDAIIFIATLEHGETHDRLVVTQDVNGWIIAELKARKLIDAPESFDVAEEGYAFWAEVLSRVELEWDHAKLMGGNRMRLTFPNAAGEFVPLCDWETPKRFEPTFDREWVLEPQPA